jgi:hypothetical protein
LQYHLFTPVISQIKWNSAPVRKNDKKTTGQKSYFFQENFLEGNIRRVEIINPKIPDANPIRRVSVRRFAILLEGKKFLI